MTPDDDGIGRNLWSAGAVGDGYREVGLYPQLIPKTFFHKRLKCLGTTLNDKRLDIVCMKTIQVQRV